MDGINAITGVYSLSILAVLVYINEEVIFFVHPDLLYYLGMSIVVFGYYNFRKKALMFAGDVGSISLAICILFLILSLVRVTAAPIVIVLLAVYGVDSVLTILRRLYKKEKVTEAHRDHLYQLLVHKKGYSHGVVASLYGMVQLVCGGLVVVLINVSFIVQWLVVISVLGTLSVAYGVAVKNITS